MSLKALVNDPHWQDLLDEVEQWEHKVKVKGLTSDDEVEIFRAQGEYAVLQKLKKLKDTVNGR